MKRLMLGIAPLWLAASAATAADLPVKPPTAAIVQSGGLYAWLDGSWQDVHLPHYNLGLVLQPGGGAISPALAVDPDAKGWGISGGVGALLPSRIGARDRFDVSGSFVRAMDSQSGGAQSGPGGLGLVLLNGKVNSGVAVDIGCATCSANGTLTSSYQSWQITGRFATDYRVGAVTFTPSLALFGGHSHNDQSLAETGFPTALPGGNFVVYGAQTALGWTDWGGRVGLLATIPISSAVSFGVGGNAGWVARNVSLSGNDLVFLNAGGAILFPAATAISLSADRGAFLGNLEGSVTFAPAANSALRIFGGLNYDNSVPGIAAPVITGNFGGVLPMPTATPANIKFEAETSFYAGAGLSVRF